MGRWDDPATVGGFAGGEANADLVAFAEAERRRGGRVAIDLGCGAARNAAPLAARGWTVAGLDSSAPMLTAARDRVRGADAAGETLFVRGRMDSLPFADACADLLVAHGIWNLARSGGEFRLAVAEGARVCRPGAGLFLFTFSRATLAPDAAPEPGETYVYRQFSGEPQCFLDEAELLAELGRVGFAPAGPPAHLNLPPGGRRLVGAGGPVIWQASFRRG